MIKNIHRRKLNRPSSHRMATLKNLATNLVKYETIKTTVAKSKELSWFIDKLITKIKNASLEFNKYRIARKYLTTESAVDKLIKVIIPRYTSVNSGYTKIARLGYRKGDNAEIAVIKFV